MGTFGIFQIKKSIFLKVADIVREIDIWPENDILGVLEWFGTLIRYLESSRSNFENIEKKQRFFGFLTCGASYVRCLQTILTRIQHIGRKKSFFSKKSHFSVSGVQKWHFPTNEKISFLRKFRRNQNILERNIFQKKLVTLPDTPHKYHVNRAITLEDIQK